MLIMKIKSFFKRFFRLFFRKKKKYVYTDKLHEIPATKNCAGNEDYSFSRPRPFSCTKPGEESGNAFNTTSARIGVKGAPSPEEMENYVGPEPEVLDMSYFMIESDDEDFGDVECANKQDADGVQFRAAAPSVFEKGMYTDLKIMMFCQDDYERADREMKTLGDNIRYNNSGVVFVKKDDPVEIILQSPDVDIEEKVIKLKWNGMYAEHTYQVYIPEDFHKKQVRFVGRIYLRDKYLTDITLNVKVENDKAQTVDATICRLNTAFVSYSRKDESVVKREVDTIRSVCRELTVFIDKEQLRTGERWEERLYYEIENCNMFILFWSKSARRSVWVNKEINHAVKTIGDSSIRPIVLEKCPPPKGLEHLHFDSGIL